MHIDESFFEAETRNDFLIEPVMKRFWAAEMECLLAVDEVCRRHEIKYFAHYGTLLGVIRHKGFIPWDDDTDLGMLRSDYDRFLIYAQDELPQMGYSVYNLSYGVEAPIRIVNTTKICVDTDFLERFHMCPFIAGPDIFPIDNYPEKSEERDVYDYLMNSTLMTGVDIRRRFDESGVLSFSDANRNILSFLSENTGMKFTYDENIHSQLAILGNNLSALYKDMPTQKVAYIKDVCQGKNRSVDRECFSECVYKPFEMIELPVPIGYDTILSTEYGNYMEPKKVYDFHNYPVYKPQLEILKRSYENLGMEIPYFLR